MADPLSKDDLVRVSASWAKDATLDEISGKVSNTNELLTRIGQVFGKRFDTRGLERNIGRTVEKVNQAADETAKAAQKNKRGTESFGKSVDDLKRTLNYDLQSSLKNYSRSIGDLVTGSRDASSMVPGLMRDIGTLGAGLVSISPKAAKMIAGLGAAMGYAVQRFLESADIYRDMMQSGALFGGSIENFVGIVRANGVSLQAAQQVINKNTQAILLTGERNFFGTVGRLGNTFDKFGLKMDQGAEVLGELFEIQRLSGSLYASSQDELTATNEKLLNLLNAQARLTGVSVRRQTEEARRIAEDERVRIIAQSLPAQMQKAITMFSTTLSAANIPADVASELVREVVTGAPGKMSGLLRTIAPTQTEELLAAARTGDVERMNQAIQRLADAARNLPLEVRTGLAFGGPPELRKLIVGLTDRSIMGGRTVEVGGQTKTAQEVFKETLDGQAVINKSTQDLFGAQGTVTRAFGNFEARIIELAKESGALDLFTKSLKTAADGLKAASTASNDTLLAAGAGIAGLYAASKVAGVGRDVAGRLMRPSTSPGLVGGPEFAPPPGGTPAAGGPRAAPAGAPSAASRASLFERLASNAKGLGKASVAGVALGGAGMGAEYFGAPAYVSRGLEYAGTGAGLGGLAGSFFGGVGAGPGAVIGGVGGLVAGSIMGALEEFGKPATPAGAPAVVEDARAASSMITTLTTRLSSIETLLSEGAPLHRQLVAINQSIISWGDATVKAVKQLT